MKKPSISAFFPSSFSWLYKKREFEYTYENVNMLVAEPDVHTLAYSLVQKYVNSKDCKFLDLGAGEGAFTLRLIRNGFNNVEVVELEQKKFKLSQVTCFNHDLNRAFSQKLNKLYDFIIAIEVIEHLENPRHFFRQCRNLLKDGGYLLITTPNIESWWCRFHFLLRGTFQSFTEQWYRAHGHITPLSSIQLEQILGETKFSLIEKLNTPRSQFYDQYSWLIKLVQVSIFCTLYPLMKGNKDGEFSLYLFQKL